ncbi:MAG TPA: hypothetical protein VNZ25_10285 [Candidatus Angelobacter sp.]|jgi:hypothetical protein|nr:hypothetical protein [Candidatus Angelobacter sp.]
MKRTIIIGLVLVAIICAAVWASYSVGYQRGLDLMLVLDQKRIFVVTLPPLQEIRAGEIEAATQQLETNCFAAADNVYDGQPANQIAADAFVDSLRHYRQTYRTNSAEWSVTEQDLEKKLINWK